MNQVYRLEGETFWLRVGRSHARACVHVWPMGLGVAEHGAGGIEAVDGAVDAGAGKCIAQAR